MKKLILLWVVAVLLFACPSLAANKIWPAVCLTVGTGCLNDISGTSLTAGDGGLTIVSSGGTYTAYIHVVVESSAEESSPSVILPLTSAGTKRWHLVKMVTADTYAEVVAKWASGACAGYLKSDGTCDSGDDIGSANYANIVALWASGTCAGYLKHDGTCGFSTGGFDEGEDYTPTGTWDFSGATITLPDSMTLTTPSFVLADASTLTLPAAAPTADGLPLTVDTDGTSQFVTGFSSITIGGFTASRNVEADGSGNLTSSDTATTGTGAPVKANSPTFDDDITLGAAGVKLTGSNGSLTILGLGNGQDEDVKIDLNTTANTIIVSSPASSATTVSFSALNLVTTGTIQGGIVISSDADGMLAADMTTAGMYGTMFIATGAGTWILPRAVLGMSGCLMDSGTAHDLILDVTAGSTIRLKGTEQADGIGITNAAGSTTGDFVCFIAVATDKWSTVGMGGAWVSQ